MKRLFALVSTLTILAAGLLPATTYAQTGNDLIVLNDSTPGIDVVINPSPNTTGVIALEIDHAAVTMTDAVGNVIFETADPSVAGLEFSFAPNAGTHTLIVERLPGAAQGYARIMPVAEMTTSAAPLQLVTNSTLALDQEADFPLNATSPSSVVNVAAPAEADYVTVTARFPGAPVTVQLVNTQENRTLATLSGGLIDGVRFKVENGAYQLVMVNNAVERNTVANVSVMAPPSSDFNQLVDQVETTNNTTLAATAPDTSTTNVTPTCALTISASSVNLRSGPGTGYSVLGYAFRGDTLAVGGVSTQGQWLLVGTEAGSGWIAPDLGTLGGNCATLTTYDIPYREAPAPQVTIQQPQVPVYHDDDGDDDDHDSEYDDHSGEYDDHSGEYDDHGGYESDDDHGDDD